MIKEAELKATQLIEKARETADDIRNSVLGLREEKALLIAKLKALINSQASILEMKMSEPKEEKKQVEKDEEPEKLDINVDDILEKLL